jgi:hypothetical protein
VHRVTSKLVVGLAIVVAGIVPAFSSTPIATAAGPIVFDGSPGTAAPPANLGPYAMTAFHADPTPNFTPVSSVASPLGGVVTFDHDLDKRAVGAGWTTWSHGYTGDVYANVGAQRDSLTLGLPANTLAFSFYVEGNSFSTFNFTATAQDGTTSGVVPVNGSSGATYFGFYGAPGNPLVSIAVAAEASASGFAIGEFGIAAGFDSEIALTKVVDGASATDAPFIVEVLCSSDDGFLVEFPATGGTTSVTVPSSAGIPTTCTVTETESAGATATTYACEGSCSAAGPDITPVTVAATAPGTSATVTILNTFAPLLRPRFTG